MQLNRVYATKEDIEKVEKDIAWYKQSISLYQDIGKKDKDSFTELVKLLKNSREQSQLLLDNALRSPSFSRFMKSAVYAAEVRVYTFVIDLVDNPNIRVEPYRREVEKLEKYLSDIRKLPKRDK